MAQMVPSCTRETEPRLYSICTFKDFFLQMAVHGDTYICSTGYLDTLNLETLKTFPAWFSDETHKDITQSVQSGVPLAVSQLLNIYASTDVLFPYEASPLLLFVFP
uniref:Uncharacterized protein n=1 Tax=Mus musculus TaxID=10090 RepID=Q8CCR9_MOUSE|nr:unnamed protein product [Mus musculus]